MTPRFPAILALLAFAGILAGCTRSESPANLTENQSDVFFYSGHAREVDVQFKAYFLTDFTSLEEFQSNYEMTKINLEQNVIPKTLMFLQGPISTRKIASRKADAVTLDSDHAWMSISGKVAVKYEYKGIWMLNNSVKKAFELPVPFNKNLLKTEAWLKCTDQHPDHQNDSFYWYYWDPTRPGCDQKKGPHYQTVKVQFSQSSRSQVLSFPDYDRLIENPGSAKEMKATFGFGYIKEVDDPDPFTDADLNMVNFRAVIEQARVIAKVLDFKESPILAGEYLNNFAPEKKVGVRFTGMRNRVRFEIKIVASGVLDQMQIFAQSFARDHDGFFAWHGHSRVGNESDLQNFKNQVIGNPEYYSVSNKYQIVYWAGCNSYTYYTNLLFKMKAEANPEQDPKGTKGLDIVSNGFSSPFSVYQANSATWLKTLINWELQFSYQNIIAELEAPSLKMGRLLMVNVLGDEDNPNVSKF